MPTGRWRAPTNTAAIAIRRKGRTVRQPPNNGGLLRVAHQGSSSNQAVKTIACGTPGVSGVTVVTNSCAFLPLHTRPRVHRAPGVPRALVSEEGGTFTAKPGRHAPREREGVFDDRCDDHRTDREGCLTIEYGPRSRSKVPHQRKLDPCIGFALTTQPSHEALTSDGSADLMSVDDVNEQAPCDTPAIPSRVRGRDERRCTDVWTAVPHILHDAEHSDSHLIPATAAATAHPCRTPGRSAAAAPCGIVSIARR